MHKFDNLPIEILLAIARELGNSYDINSLARTSRYFFNILNKLLYRHDALFHNMSALWWASTRGATATALKSINASSGYTHKMINLHKALIKAALVGHANVASCILAQEGVNPNFRAEDRQVENTPLKIAASEGHADVVKVLLSAKGIDLNFGDPGETALSLAASQGHAAVVELLLGAPGIDPDHPDHNGHTPLFEAVCSESPETVWCFLQRTDLKINFNVEDLQHHPLRRIKGRNLLIVASDLELPDIVKLLLTAPGIQVNHRDERSKTALHFAARNGSEDIVKSLLEHQADPDPRDKANETPLFLAAIRGSLSVVKMLLEAGADPNHTCYNKCHPLGAARTYGHNEVAQALLESERIDLGSLKRVPRNWNYHRGRQYARMAKRRPFYTS